MDIDEVLAHHLLDHRIIHLFNLGSVPVYLTAHGVMIMIAVALLASMVIAARCGGGLVLSRKHASRVGALQDLVSKLSASTVKLAGVVLNDFQG